ncbi:hypothetical protein PFISCL1PPCAC_44 [Pristionchus fissidentatus]|uniref:Uncharacterized protein n=1 Tax=Pristionchus fissidentatus TaxID=1538716 RepID=A0AAV5UQ94_9BILA|nr:hypothetical protein PFISCL1PPCAC_44 [Pristionchus fissidentatus]
MDGLPSSRLPTVITLHRNHSAHSSTTSLTSEHRRVPGIRYPTAVSSGADARMTPATRTASPASGAAIDRLREENARLRLRTEEITTDSNRRVEMHVAEIRMLKEESKRLRSSIDQLEGERNKARQLAHEWHKFARYSSDLVKQEVRGYDAKLKDAQARMRRLREENEELKQICFYLDAQRHAASASTRRRSARSEEESDDQGCGSSNHSVEEGETTGGFCLQKEDSLRRICQREEESEGAEREQQGVSNDRILDYIHSLESRIKHLEMTTTNPHSDSWRSSMTPEDDLTVMEREWHEEAGGMREGRRGQTMDRPHSTSTMTSSGTTFCSSEMDETMSNSSVYVDGSEPNYSHLEVRTLAPIEEELSQSMEGKRLSAEVALSALLPPCIEPISSSTMALGRLRSDGRLSEIGWRQNEDASVLRLPNGREPQSVSEAVDALRIRENRQSTAPGENPYATWSSNEPKYQTAL